MTLSRIYLKNNKTKHVSFFFASVVEEQYFFSGTFDRKGII